MGRQFKLQGFRIAPSTCRAARRLLGWSVRDLAKKSLVPGRSISLFEDGQRALYPRTLDDITMAFESAGIVFGKGSDPQLE